MFQIGDRVIYGSHGVCQIVTVEERVIDRKRIKYFALEPVSQPGTRYLIPSENPVALSKLRHLITRDELEQLLQSQQIRENCWISDENQRKQRYRELISSCDRVALLRMIHTLHHQKKVQLEAGRKFHLCDENFLHDAQKLLTAEFSLVLNIDPSAVADYILSAMDQ